MRPSRCPIERGLVIGYLTGMTMIQNQLMRQLYGHDIWDNFVPRGPAQEVQGWNGNHPSLGRIAQQASGEVLVVDVGVWKGQSTINMALAMKQREINGCVIAVDTFLGSPEHWDWNRGLFERKNGLPDLYLTFLENVHYAGVADYIIPMPQTSVTAALILQRAGLQATIAHIDAAHEYEEVLRDAQEYWKILKPGGYMIGDDYDKSWPGVIQAAGEFSAMHKAPLAIELPKWIIQK